MGQSKVKNIVVWIIQILLAALFIITAEPKLTSQPEVLENFNRWGLSGKMYLVIGFFELLGAIGLLIPKTAGLAAIGLILIMLGAFFIHLTHNELSNSIFPLVFILLLAVVVYFRRPFAKK